MTATLRRRFSSTASQTTAAADLAAKPPAAADTGTVHWRRRLVVASATTAAAVAITTVAGGWHFADELLQVRRDPPERPVEVLDLRDGRVTLRGTDANQPGQTGLEWDGGYARLLPDIVEHDDGSVTRGIVAFPDLPSAGTRARVDFYAFPRDLRSVTDVPAEDVVYDGPLGTYPATYLPGAHGVVPVTGGRQRWIIYVHGRGAERAEAWRLAAALHPLGYTQLAITYRNDEGAPRDRRGTYGLGWTEAADLGAALAYARDQGAEDVVLVGFSMGGAVVGNYLRTHSTRDRLLDVAGVIYDSPVVSWPSTLVHHAGDRGLPGFAGSIALGVVRARTGIDVAAMDQVRTADAYDRPVLLVHGAADSTVPVVASDEFAATRPDLVSYLRTDAEHVQSWNIDPSGYEASVVQFLDKL